MLCSDSGSEARLSTQTGSTGPLHHANWNAAQAPDSHPHVPGVEADPTRLDFQRTKWFIVVHGLISTLPLPAVQTLPAATGGGHLSHVQAPFSLPFRRGASRTCSRNRGRVEMRQ